MKTVDVIIPTYKPGKKLKNIIKALQRQTYKINKIIVINTERNYFISAFGSDEYFKDYGNVQVYHISKDEFDHAATRTLGVSHSNSDMFIMMTDDAVPKSRRLIEELVMPLILNEAQVVYGRQCVEKNANAVERYTRLFNYPKVSKFKNIEDKKELGIKTYFCSDVCAAYNRKVFNELGGYVDRAIFNEDMIYASKIIENGYTIYYNANARVTHYHKYTNVQQLRRNFDLGVSQAMHPEVFENMPSTGEGIKLVKETFIYLLKTGNAVLIPGMIITSAFKYIGFWLGKRYNKLPIKLIMKITMNKTFWSKTNL